MISGVRLNQGEIPAVCPFVLCESYTLPNAISPAGCATCKTRRIKCDLGSPSCQNCVKRNFSCPGYPTALQWKEKHQLSRSTSTGAAKHGGHSSQLSALGSSHQCLGLFLCHGRHHGHGSQRTSSNTQVLHIPSFAGGNHFLASPLSAGVASSSASSHARPTETTNAAMMLVPFLHPHFQIPDEKRMLLFAHYFHTVCAIYSCFDSFANPFRTDMEVLVNTSPLIQSCILSMSAAHLRNTHPHWSLDGLQYLTVTQSKLMREINAIVSDRSLSTIIDQKLDHILLGVIMLGMTTSWHASAGLGLEHIRGSRALFPTWIQRKFRDRLRDDSYCSQLHFYLGMQAYWEAMASFLIDQDMHQQDYLFDAFNTFPVPSFYIHPWTGISAKPWLYMAKAGCIIRSKRRLVYRGSSSRNAEANDVTVGNSLQCLEQEAQALISQILSYTIPNDSQIRDTYDEHTPKSHLMDIARCCQLASLLELHRAFDTIHERQAILDLIGNGVETHQYDTREHPSLHCTDLVRELSLRILQILSGIPVESGTRSLHHLLLAIAGSALLPPIMLNPPVESNRPSLTSSANASEDSALPPIQFWRLFVLDRISFLERFINLDGIRKLRLLLEKVWARGDTLFELDSQLQTGLSVGRLHWIDVMEETGLQFFL